MGIWTLVIRHDSDGPGESLVSLWPSRELATRELRDEFAETLDCADDDDYPVDVSTDEGMIAYLRASGVYARIDKHEYAAS